jgi:hypothetical protein
VSIPSHTTVRTEDRLRCECGARFDAEAVQVSDGRFFAICRQCHRDLFSIDFEDGIDDE